MQPMPVETGRNVAIVSKYAPNYVLFVLSNLKAVYSVLVKETKSAKLIGGLAGGD